MKTAKIKEVVSAKPHHNGNIYHNLVMDNGDKINIGKKKEQKVGYELTYEIIDEQSGEYKQSKSVQPLPQTTATNTTTQSNPSGLNVQNLIVAQSSLATAADFLKSAGCTDPEDVITLANDFYKWVLTKG
jgi:hypothetical protein